MNPFLWTVRVRAEAARTVTVHARNHAFPIGDPLSFRPTDEHPSALEMMLGALAADLTATFRTLAHKQRLPLDALEFSASCCLHNPLVALDVVGEEGHPGIARIEGTLYVSADAEAEALEALWQETLRRSPLYNTLSGALELQLRLSPTL
ncbi:MAG TPA: OsmC family protein [Chthonomonadaceae bacterium]|nr:OsmC family protein [Chthonomonadaceae bacterium]